MGPAETARADQILAVLREADRPVEFPELWAALGNRQWGVARTVQLLAEMYTIDLIDVAVPAHCPFCAQWIRPIDN